MNRSFLSPSLIRLALWIERWVLAGMSLFFAWDHCLTLWLLHLVRTSRGVLPVNLAQSDAGLASGVNFDDVARYGLLAAANLVVGIFLLSGRPPTRPPRRALEIFVPLVATYCAVLLNVPGAFPTWATTPLVPARLEIPLAAMGLVLSAVGGLVSLGGLLWLGRSLGIFVSVRKVILAGPYRWMRHPIYAGYALSLVGLSLTGCTARLVIIVAISVGLLVWRARLEENALCAASPAYRRRQVAVGFFLPRLNPLRRPPGRAGERGKVPGELAPTPVLLFNARSTHG